MKKTFYSVLSLFLVIVFMIPAMTVFAATEEVGVIFTAVDKYILSAKIDIPITIEATISLPKNFEGRGGVVVGNYDGQGSACMNLEIHENGVPRLYITDNNKTVYDVKFSSIDVRTGKPVHIAITYDQAAKKLSAYKDGVLAQTVSKPIPVDVNMASVLRVGGDNRTGNTQNFKGTLYSLAFWSDVRSTLEINADKEKVSSDADGLIGAWDMSEYPISEPPAKVENIGTRTLNINYKEDGKWKRDGGFKGSFDFSLRSSVTHRS